MKINMATKQKMVSRSKLNINGVIKEIVDHGNVDTVSVQENLDRNLLKASVLI